MMMGLDMYLYKREYVGGWDWKIADEDKDERAMYDTIREYMNAERCEGSPHAYVEICVAYWRKANAVHKWFCDLDGGRDECQSIYVTKDKLIELRDLCNQIIGQPAMAASALPTQPGFFFGSYDYDDWYMEDMKNTVSQIDQILESVGDKEYADFIYRASW
jgi:hypothetical protein